MTFREIFGPFSRAMRTEVGQVGHVISKYSEPSHGGRADSERPAIVGFANGRADGEIAGNRIVHEVSLDLVTSGKT